jgi:uncharacterized protein
VTVSAHTAFPADGFVAAWATVGDDHGERVTLRWENEAWTAATSLTRERVELVIRLSPLWMVRQALLFRDLDEPDLWLGTDGHGHWGEINGAHRIELDGSVDVTVAARGNAISAFVHTVPVRRLPVDVGGSFDTRVVEIDVETLGLERVLRTYRRVDAAAWEVSQPDGVVCVTVDEYGLPVDIDGHFRRVA